MAERKLEEAELSGPEYSVVLQNFERIVKHVKQGIPTLLNHFLSRGFIHPDEYERLLQSSHDSNHTKSSTLVFYVLQQIREDSSNLKVFFEILNLSGFTDLVEMLLSDLKEMNTKYQILNAHYVLLVAAFRSNLTVVLSYFFKNNLISKEVKDQVSDSAVERDITRAAEVVNYLLMSVLKDSNMYKELLIFLHKWRGCDPIGSMLLNHPSVHQHQISRLSFRKTRGKCDEQQTLSSSIRQDGSYRWRSYSSLTRRESTLLRIRLPRSLSRSLSFHQMQEMNHQHSQTSPEVSSRRHSCSAMTINKSTLSKIPLSGSKDDCDIEILAARKLVEKIEDMEFQMEQKASKGRKYHFRSLSQNLLIKELENQLERCRNKILELTNKEDGLRQKIEKMKAAQSALEKKNSTLMDQLRSQQYDHATDKELKVEIEINKAKIQDRDKRITELQYDLAHVNRELGKTQHEIQVLEKEKEQASKKKASEIDSEWKEKAKEHQDKVKEKDTELEIMKKELEKMKKEKKELEKVNKDYQDKLNEKDVEITRHHEQLNESSVCPDMMCLLI